MQGLAEIHRLNDADHGDAAAIKIPNERSRRLIVGVCNAINETCKFGEYRDNPQRADDFAFGFVRGVLHLAVEEQHPATYGFASALLARVNSQGIEAVRAILATVTGDQ